MPTTSFRNVSQFASFAGFFPQLFTYFFTTCRLVKGGGCGGGLELGSVTGPLPDREVATAKPGMSTATAITKILVNGVFMSLPPDVSISTMSVEEP
jgi:hypothetical protein